MTRRTIAGDMVAVPHGLGPLEAGAPTRVAEATILLTGVLPGPTAGMMPETKVRRSTSGMARQKTVEPTATVALTMPGIRESRATLSPTAAEVMCDLVVVGRAQWVELSVLQLKKPALSSHCLVQFSFCQSIE